MNKGNNGLQLVVMNAGAGNQVYLRKTNVTTIARSNVVGGVPADGTFHHVVATMDGTLGSARIYIDGVEASTVQVANATLANTAFVLAFGSGASTAAVFDEFALYDAGAAGLRDRRPLHHRRRRALHRLLRRATHQPCSSASANSCTRASVIPSRCSTDSGCAHASISISGRVPTGCV